MQERLADYPGTVLLVSHDRDFLDRVAASVIATEGDGRWIEYAGGYTDMLAQRAPSQRGPPPDTPSAPKPPSRKPPAATPPPARPRRMSFKDRQALENLPARIAALQRRIAGLNLVLADVDLYRSDARRFSETTHALAAAQAELSAAEQQWLSLEILREEIGDRGPNS